MIHMLRAVNDAIERAVARILGLRPVQTAHVPKCANLSADGYFCLRPPGHKGWHGLLLDTLRIWSDTEPVSQPAVMLPVTDDYLNRRITSDQWAPIREAHEARGRLIDLVDPPYVGEHPGAVTEEIALARARYDQLHHWQ